MTDAVQWRVGTEVTVFRFFESDAKRPLRLKPGMMGIVVGVDGPWTSQANLHVQVSFGRKKKWRSTWVFPHLHLDAMMPTYAPPKVQLVHRRHAALVRYLDLRSQCIADVCRPLLRCQWCDRYGDGSNSYCSKVCHLSDRWATGNPNIQIPVMILSLDFETHTFLTIADLAKLTAASREKFAIAQELGMALVTGSSDRNTIRTRPAMQVA